MDNNVVQETTDYGQFRQLAANREVGKGHVSALVKAFEDVGNLTRVQPILVNENFEIIDGQHRFEAAKEMGAPIFYTVVPGLGINEARSMNILHKGWRTDDYARSYAESGDASYARYLRLREETGMPHSTILAYATGGVDRKGVFSQFRNGELEVTPEQYQRAKERLDHLAGALEFAAGVNTKEFSYALLRAMDIEGYDPERMTRKLERYGGTIPKYASVIDYQRALEEIYNKDMTIGNHLRLF